MRAAVLSTFPSFTERYEGRVSTMYLDELELVTVGVGNLIEPMGAALGLPFVFADGRPASHEEIAADWRAIKSRPELAEQGWTAAAKIAKLHLSPASIDALVAAKLREMDGHIVARFPAFEEWPCDAQLGMISMAWAAGPGVRAPKFDAAARALDFATCALQCRLHTRRDAVNELLFQNAAAVMAAGADPDVLHWPAKAEFPPAGEESGPAGDSLAPVA